MTNVKTNTFYLDIYIFKLIRVPELHSTVKLLSWPTVYIAWPSSVQVTTEV